MSEISYMEKLLEGVEVEWKTLGEVVCIRFRELFLRCIVRRGVDSSRLFIKNAWKESLH